jgi:hypothetical protein
MTGVIYLAIQRAGETNADRASTQREVCNMRYVVYVVAIFAASESGAKLYDVWENALTLNSEGARNALEGGLRISKKLLSSTPKLRALGYPEEPVLYAVRSVDTEDLPAGTENYPGGSTRLTKVATINEREFEAIKSFEPISIPYGVIYIDRS